MSKLGEQNINWEAPPPKGSVFIDICDGVAGPHVSIGDEASSLRVAGLKAWGGGRAIHQFTATIESLREALDSYGEQV